MKPYVLLMLLCAPIVHAVIIQEVYPDPVLTDTGGEAVLLYNDNDTTIDISQWTLGTPSSATDATVPADTLLAPHGLHLIADAGWSTNKDDTTWADASHEEALTLTNSGGTLTLRDANGSVVDSTSYPAAEQGIAYWRSTNALSPTEPLFSRPLDSLYLLALGGTLEGTNTSMNASISVTDNGIVVHSLRPLPGTTKYLSVTVMASDAPTLTFLNVSQPMETLGNNRYTAEIGIASSLSPGQHTISATGGLAYTLTVLPLLAIDTDITTLSLGNTVERTLTIEGDDTFGTAAPTVRNSGNVNAELHLSRTTLLNNGTRRTGNVSVSAGATALPLTSTSTYLTTLAPGQSAPLSFSLQLSESAPLGSYTTSIAFQLKQG